MKYTIQTLSLSTLLLCVACVQPAEITSKPVDVAYVSKSSSTGVNGYRPTEVRSFNKENNKRLETIGAVCSFTGYGYSGKVMTPGVVNLPDFGNKSQVVTFKCSDGSTTETVQAKPYNQTSANVMNTQNQGGLVGVLILATYDTFRNRDDDVWAYSPVAVEFGDE